MNAEDFKRDLAAALASNPSMAARFEVAKRYAELPLEELPKLLACDDPDHRLGAVCIMDFAARDKRTAPETREALFHLYVSSLDRIDQWDMVDRAAPHVVGGFPLDKDRSILDELAASPLISARRTAIVATWMFIREGQIDDTFRIAETLAHDPESRVHMAVGSWLREAGKRDPERLIAFLRKHGPTMPRIALRYAVEKLDPLIRAELLAA